MKRENVIWLLLFLIGGGFLIARASMGHGMGKQYVEAVTVNADHESGGWTRYEQAGFTDYYAAQQADPNQTKYMVSFWRSLGIWVAALFTLFILSFLYKDNPLYKIAESCVVGVSAAYWMVIGFWTMIVPNLFGKLAPEAVRAWALPDLDASAGREWVFLVPAILGVMLLWRLAPKGGWISRWPMAFIIGTFCGLRLISFLHADFLSQIRNGIVPLWVTDAAGAFDFWDSLRNVFLIAGVLACLVYFFFSIEHKGAVGHTARVGIWFLMVTFGAAFGYTVMGRIALLAIRIEFLFDDWLWLIDPTGRRAVETVALMLM
jgi:hypothetical protein